MNAACLMIQGTTSDAGKSLVTTALCRWLAERGVDVVPFKPQNMALNSAVTVDGGEIGRSQAVQALACGLPAHSDMNPVLLKPTTETTAQVIVQGRVVADMGAEGYLGYKRTARRAVFESYRRLADAHEAVIVEGAGSPAEINLRENDIANMGFAEAVDCPVLLVADIDRGGVFAQIIGTLALLSASERDRVAGFVINRFRGDPKLLKSGLDWLEGETGKPVFGVLPYLQGLHLEAEDALTIAQVGAGPGALRVAVPVYPRISNHTDFDPLRLHPRVDVRFVGPGERIPVVDLIILPGSKAVRQDLQWLRGQGWDRAIRRHLRYGGKVMGICGGFQMLGEAIHDPSGTEGDPGGGPGLGLLELETTLSAPKRLHEVSGVLALDRAAVCTGYEIHTGISRGAALHRPALLLADGADGAVSDDGLILGTYVHGLFESASACDALLAWAGMAEAAAPDYARLRLESIQRLADAVDTHMDTRALASLLDLNRPLGWEAT